jgi:hypothetical protein
MEGVWQKNAERSKREEETEGRGQLPNNELHNLHSFPSTNRLTIQHKLDRQSCSTHGERRKMLHKILFGKSEGTESAGKSKL